MVIDRSKVVYDSGVDAETRQRVNSFLENLPVDVIGLVGGEKLNVRIDPVVGTRISLAPLNGEVDYDGFSDLDSEHYDMDVMSWSPGGSLDTRGQYNVSDKRDPYLKIALNTHPLGPVVS